MFFGKCIQKRNQSTNKYFSEQFIEFSVENKHLILKRKNASISCKINICLDFFSYPILHSVCDSLE
jgi:hypothetical protein